MAPIEYLSSDCIVTWSIRRLCNLCRSFTSHCLICDQTNICWVAIENRQISYELWRYFTAIQRILVWLQIWKREVKELLNLQNLSIDNVRIQSECRYSIGAKVAGIIKWNRSPVSPQPKHRIYMSRLGNNWELFIRSGLLGGSWTGAGPSDQF